jgi:cellulose synthase/poly-beta-1,6-N-acetylglucosamine synthase-like glycosyltransferase
MDDCNLILTIIFQIIYIFCQLIYLIAFLTDAYLLTRPKDVVDMSELPKLNKKDYPYIVLVYPVLKEPKATMQTAFRSMQNLDYPRNRFRIVSIPNSDDLETIKSLKELQAEFDFLEIMEIPPTSDSSWQIVWDKWEQNEKAYWWHIGAYAKDTNLPPKKTRQLIYAFYCLAKEYEQKEDFLFSYIDADTCLPSDHFLAAAVGIGQYDVLQATNIAGNLNETLASALHSLDHIIWDSFKYPHLSANGKHPYWVLGKALFFKASDLMYLGSFHPWMAIEDPEVGLRFWKNGKKLGIIETPVIEEVPKTFKDGIIQRKRWVCGFFQTLSEPLTQLKLTPYQKLLAWCNFIPCLLLWINIFGWPTSLLAIIGYLEGYKCLPIWVVYLSLFNICSSIIMLVTIFVVVWSRVFLVLGNSRERIWYVLKVNPITSMIWWLFWIVPLWLGFYTFIKYKGHVWIRTNKSNPNAELIKSKITKWFRKNKDNL